MNLVKWLRSLKNNAGQRRTNDKITYLQKDNYFLFISLNIVKNKKTNKKERVPIMVIRAVYDIKYIIYT